MQHWSRKKGMMGDDPPYLAVGTEVSAKYKGAFCEAKVRKVVRSVKCKVTFKLGLGTAIITDDQIRGTLRVGSTCEVKHPDKKEFVEATINKIQDCSQYTVVFDDGDITTLRRTALCLKSGRHFAESETLDQLPLTHPEHFGNPVIGGRKGRRSRQTHDDSSDDEDAPKKGKRKEEKEADIGKVVCVELGDKKKQKDNWFPGLVVAPTAQDTVRIRVKDDYLVRSFKDGRYFTVPKKEATEFTREIGAKVDNNTLRTAVEKALLYLDRDELPPHWDRDLLFGMDESSGNSDSDGFDSDSSDDEPREEKDHFVAQLYKFMDDRGTPINKGPIIGNKDVDLYKLFKVVHKLGGYNRVTNQNHWKIISHKLGFGQGSASIVNLVKQAYKKFLHSFEDFYRKLGCTMVNHPRGNRSRHRSGRSLIRDRDRATPINSLKDKEKASTSTITTNVTTTTAPIVTAVATASTSTATVVTSQKSQESSEKDISISVPDKKSDEKSKDSDKKEKLEETSKTKDLRKEKHKLKDDKIENPIKEKLKSKSEEVPSERSRSKEDKNKTVSTAKTDSEDKDRLRVRETRKDDKLKGIRLRVLTEDDNSNSSTSKSDAKNNEEQTRSRNTSNTATPSPSSLQEDSNSEDKIKGKEEKLKIKDTKPKGKETKAKREEKLKSIADKTKLKEDKSDTKQKDEKLKEEKIKTIATTTTSSSTTAATTTTTMPATATTITTTSTTGITTAISTKTTNTATKTSTAGTTRASTAAASKTVAATKSASVAAAKANSAQNAKVTTTVAVVATKVTSTTTTKTPSVATSAATKVTTPKAVTAATKITPATTKSTAMAVASKVTATVPKSVGATKIVTAVKSSATVTTKATTIATTTVSVTVTTSPVTVISAALLTATTVTSTIADATSSLAEEVKPDDAKKKIDKKMEEEEKQTRSKSKEDLRQKKDTVTPERRPSESQLPLKESDKRIPPRLKKGEDEMAFVMKKRGRKRKDTDEKSKSEENLGQLASYISVGVGDKLKVYYGPTHESKVTYEAKVLDIEEDGNESVYLVHYTGWNTRYDEWIKRGRIADNLSWTPSRAKRLRHQQAQAQLKTSKPVLGKRGRPSLSSRTQDASNTQPPRSTTPSSVTSSSSRTKSPATSGSRSGSSRVTRNTSDSNSSLPGPEFRRRTRRMSGHTDMSMASESESEEYESEVEIEPTQTRSRTEKRNLLIEKEEMTIKEESQKDEIKKFERPFRRKVGKRKEEEDDEDKESTREDENVDILETESTSEVQNVDKRRSKRTKKAPPTPNEKQDDEPKLEQTSKQETLESEEEQPKGRDFDLNEIRSELKGIEKAVKLPQDVLHRTEEKCSQMILDDKTGLIDIKYKTEEEEVQTKFLDQKIQEKPDVSNTEDIYEFKEPEPFEFEVRSKRELLSDERLSKLNRRPRIFDDIVEPKLDKSSRKKLVRSTTNKADNKDDSSFDGEIKKRCRRSGPKKSDLGTEIKRKEFLGDELELSPSKSLQVEPSTPQKLRPATACEEAFDKLCESPSFHTATKSEIEIPTTPKTVKSPELGPLILFSELPGEGPDDECEDDSEDRLVISETDETETETEEPLFTYPRHHEELFSALGNPESAVVPDTTVEQLLPLQKQSPEPPPLLPGTADIFKNFGSGVDMSVKSDDTVQKETDNNEESEKSNKQSSRVQMDDDVMKLLLKGSEEDEDDKYEDDPINAAIQRVIEQSMTDEESNDMDIFSSKRPISNIASLHQIIPATPKSESQSNEESRKDTSPKEQTKRKSSGRKPVLSKEFVEDTDSDTDTSDEEERLVIAKDDDNMSSSSSQCSLKLRVSESSDFEMKLRLSDREEDSKAEVDESENKLEINISVRETSPPATASQDVEHFNKEEPVEEINKNIEAEVEDSSLIKSDNEVPTASPSQDVEPIESEKNEYMDVKPIPSNESITVPNTEKVVDAEKDEENVEGIVPINQTSLEKSDEKSETEKCEEEAESNIRSLLCEETIPGSPAPLSENTQVTDVCQEEPEGNKTTPVLEMPFASAPSSNCTPSSSNSANSGKSTVQPIFTSPVIEPPITTTTTTPLTIDVSASIPVQTGASPSISPLPPPQIQAQVQPVSSVPVSVAGPGSGSGHQGSGPGLSKRNSNEAAPVMDNTPPTTPDSTLSTISGSPREERDGMSPTMDNESSKSHRDSFEIDLDSCPEGNKVDHYSEEDSLLNIEVSNSSENRIQGLKLLPKKSCSDLDKEMDSSPKKRRRSRKRSECESNKRSRHSSGRSSRNIGIGSGSGGGGGSDSDDTSETSTAGGCTPLTSSENVLSSRSPRPSKYNFYVELDPELDGTQRIALLQQKLQELRKTYMNVKAELACIDRRRKKLRRREREEKATKPEVVCS